MTGQTELVDRAQCIAVTIAGTRCTRHALDDGDLCKQHAHRVQPRTPTGLSQETQEAIFSALENGMSLERAIVVAGASRSTVYDWLRMAKEPGSSDDYRAFAAAIDLSRARLEQWTLEQLKAAGENGNVSALKVLLARINPDDHGDGRRRPGQTRLPLGGAAAKRADDEADQDTNVVQLRPASGDAHW